MSGKKNIVILSASPKPTKSTAASAFLAEMFASRVEGAEVAAEIINVRESITKNQTAIAYQKMTNADAIVFIFPLYVFCLPGILIRFLQDFETYVNENGRLFKETRLYAIINCGFAEPEINLEAAHVIKSFSQKVGAAYGFSILIGSGGMLQSTLNAPFMKKTKERLNSAFDSIKHSVLQPGAASDVYISAGIPAKIYYAIASISWRYTIKKNGLKQKDLYRKPYREE